mgnify:CR=1 FL=1
MDDETHFRRDTDTIRITNMNKHIILCIDLICEFVTSVTLFAMIIPDSRVLLYRAVTIVCL